MRVVIDGPKRYTFYGVPDRVISGGLDDFRTYLREVVEKGNMSADRVDDVYGLNDPETTVVVERQECEAAPFVPVRVIRGGGDSTPAPDKYRGLLDRAKLWPLPLPDKTPAAVALALEVLRMGGDSDAGVGSDLRRTANLLLTRYLESLLPAG